MKPLIKPIWGVVSMVTFSCQKEDMDWITDQRPLMACTKEYVPVCGCDGKTYSNSCVAENAGVTSYTDGSCQ